MFIMSFFSSFKIIKVAVSEPYFFYFFEFLHQLLKQLLPFLMELKYFFAKGTATFINGPADLLNNDPRNPPD